VRAQDVDERAAAQVAPVLARLGRRPAQRLGGEEERERGARERQPREDRPGQPAEHEHADGDDRGVGDERRGGDARAGREAALERGADDEREQRPGGQSGAEAERQAEEQLTHSGGVPSWPAP
jgi:hypothetical protein